MMIRHRQRLRPRLRLHLCLLRPKDGPERIIRRPKTVNTDQEIAAPSSATNHHHQAA